MVRKTNECNANYYVKVGFDRILTRLQTAVSIFHHRQFKDGEAHLN